MEIVRQKSLTKAGSVLSLTQSSVSKTLSELEQELGVILVKRSRGGILLTDEGREFYRYAGMSVASLRNGFDAISRGTTLAKTTLRVGTLITVAARMMTTAIMRYRESFPQSHIMMMTESSTTLLHKLRHGEIDMIIGRLPERAEAVGFSFEPLYHERLLFVVRNKHPLLRRKAFALQNISNYPFIITGFHNAIRQDVERFIAAQGIPLVEPTLAINNPDFGRQFLLKSDAIWCAPLGVIEQDVIAGRLGTLPIDTNHLRTTIAITTRADQSLEGSVLAFADIVRSIAVQLNND